MPATFTPLLQLVCLHEAFLKMRIRIFNGNLPIGNELLENSQESFVSPIVMVLALFTSQSSSKKMISDVVYCLEHWPMT